MSRYKTHQKLQQKAFFTVVIIELRSVKLKSSPLIIVYLVFVRETKLESDKLLEVTDRHVGIAQ